MKEYDEVELLKFVYDFDTGRYKITTKPQHYEDRPWHANLMESLSYDDPDIFDHHTVQAYFLLEEGQNALDYDELPAMTIACRSDPIPPIVKAFTDAGYKPLNWYNANTKQMVPLGQVTGKIKLADEDGYYDDDYDDGYSDNYDVGHPGDRRDYDEVPSKKFVYDQDEDDYELGTSPQTYYERPHHSDYMEDLAGRTGNWDMEGVHSGYVYLGHGARNALTYGDHPPFPGLAVTTFPPHQGIIDDFRNQGTQITHWVHRQRGGNTTVHEIPQVLPQGKPKTTHMKLTELNEFSLIKFVSLPDKFLVGENTHHAYLLEAEYGSKVFPSDTGAIGRAWMENNQIHGVGFDFGSPKAQQLALHQLGNWAKQHGYDYSDKMDDHIIGLAKIASPTYAWASQQFGLPGQREFTNAMWNGQIAPWMQNPQTGEIHMRPKAVEHNEIKGGGEARYTFPRGWYNPSTGQILNRPASAYHSQGMDQYQYDDPELTPEFKQQLDQKYQETYGQKTSKLQLPEAFVYSNGHMYYGIDHGQIMDDHDVMDDGLYGRLHERRDGRYDLELYSDYAPDQTKEQLHEALPLLLKNYDIADIKQNSVIPHADMADAEQFFAESAII